MEAKKRTILVVGRTLGRCPSDVYTHFLVSRDRLTRARSQRSGTNRCRSRRLGGGTSRNSVDNNRIRKFGHSRKNRLCRGRLGPSRKWDNRSIGSGQVGTCLMCHGIKNRSRFRRMYSNLDCSCDCFGIVQNQSYERNLKKNKNIYLEQRVKNDPRYGIHICNTQQIYRAPEHIYIYELNHSLFALNTVAPSLQILGSAENLGICD